MPDDRARLLHIIDQLQAELEEVLRAMAPIVARYHTALVSEGTSAPDAMTLALDMQKQMLAEYILSSGD